MVDSTTNNKNDWRSEYIMQKDIADKKPTINMIQTGVGFGDLR